MSEKTQEPFKSWGVFKNPSDYPDGYVARLFHGTKPTDTCIMTPNYEVIELQMLEMGLYKIHRLPNDEPQIMEVWL